MINDNISARCIFYIFVLSINLIIIINSITIHNFTFIVKFCELMIILLLNYNNDIKFCTI